MVHTRKKIDALDHISESQDIAQSPRTTMNSQPSTSSNPLVTKTLDERLLRKPVAPTCDTAIGLSTNIRKTSGFVHEPSATLGHHQGHPQSLHHANTRSTTFETTKLDTITGTLATLQESIRELHNEFSAIKPRISQFKTSTSGSTMLVKSSVSDDPVDVYKDLLKKRSAKNITQ